jgi:hypothetical protein
MSAQQFNWLHLSDLHYGQPEQGHSLSSLRQTLFDDLKRIHDRCGPWDAIFFTGDLVYSGKRDDFLKLDTEVLSPIREEVYRLGSKEVVLLAVPGNHDLVRPKRQSAVYKVLANWGKMKGMEKDFWSPKHKEYRDFCASTLANYKNWWQKAGKQENVSITDGVLVGDFSATISIPGRRIGVVGLNTTFLQLSNKNFKGHLVWDPCQLQSVCGGDIERWRADHDVCILLTHQGPDWLDKRSQSAYTEINPAGRFAVHMFGHMHEPFLESKSFGGGGDVIYFQSPSLFGLDYFGKRQERLHGYVAGSVVFNASGSPSFVRFWPRRADKNSSSGLNFHPNHTNLRLEEDEGTRRFRLDALSEPPSKKLELRLFRDTVHQDASKSSVASAVADEINKIVLSEVTRSQCHYLLTFKAPYKGMPRGYMVVRRDLDFIVTNITDREISFPIRSSYSGDEDLSSDWWHGSLFHRKLLINDHEEIEIREGKNLFIEDGMLVLKEVVDIQPGKSKKIFITGEEPCRIDAGRNIYIQGSPVVGIWVRIENDYHRAIDSINLQMLHPGASEATRDGFGQYVLERAFLPGQGFQVTWVRKTRTSRGRS